MIAWILAAAAFAAIPEAERSKRADEPRFEASAELGQLRDPSSGYDLFSDGNRLPSWGLRAGVAPIEHVTVLAGWHTVRRGAQGDGLVAALSVQELSLGAKADFVVLDYLRPYAKADALLAVAQARLDDAPDDRDNPGQVQRSAIAPGFLAAGGIEVRAPVRPDRALALAGYMEIGYGATLALKFQDLGETTPRGLLVRGGLGVRF